MVDRVSNSIPKGDHSATLTKYCPTFGECMIFDFMLLAQSVVCTLRKHLSCDQSLHPAHSFVEK